MNIRNELTLQLYEQKMDCRAQPHYREEYERYRAIRQGDIYAARLLTENGTLRLCADERVLSGSTVKNLCYHFVIEASALAAVCMENGLSHDEAHTISDIYIRKLDRVVSEEEIGALYKQMCLDYSARMSEIRRGSAVSRHVRKCIRYIYENLGGDLSMPVLAAVTGLNQSYLSRLFAKEVGCPIRQFILAARVDTAQDLLLHSELSCSRIAASLGFSSQSAFIAVFRRFAHMTPGAYRKHCSPPGC